MSSAFTLVIALLTIIASWLNMLHDTPHEPESRPAYMEVCWFEDYSKAWLEHATSDTAYVCDGTGEEWISFTFDKNR